MTDDEETYEVTVSATVTVRKKQPEVIEPPIDPIPPPIDPIDPPPAGEDATVTAPNGQWWRFKGALQNGVYVNGDPWVLDTGDGVSLIEVSAPTTAGNGGNVVHGGMINPTWNTMVEKPPMGSGNAAPMKQGYDGRLIRFATATVYDAALNAHTNLPRTLHAGDSLVSAVSLNPDNPVNPGSNPQWCQRMACVTVVDAAPSEDEFRPPYYGTAKPRWRLGQADLSLLPDLSAVSPFNPKGTWFEGFHLDEASAYAGASQIPGMTQIDIAHRNSFRDMQYWIIPANTDGSLFKPQFNQEWYPRDWGVDSGQLAMYILINPEDRDKFVIRILQVAIDAYACAKDADGAGVPRAVPFAGGAGFWASPLWYIRLAGLLFDDADMKDAVNISTGLIDFYGNPITKWGIKNRCYFSTNAHAQYRRVAGESYLDGFPLYGDMPWTDITNAPGDNNTVRDPAGIYDMTPYKLGLPKPAYPDILDSTYEMWKVGEAEYGDIGAYPFMTNAGQGDVLASIAMGDEAFWGGAVVAYAHRHANDPQMWTGWGVTHDYSDAFTPAKQFYRDIYGAGGSGSGWMAQMWDIVTERVG